MQSPAHVEALSKSDGYLYSDSTGHLTMKVGVSMMLVLNLHQTRHSCLAADTFSFVSIPLAEEGHNYWQRHPLGLQSVTTICDFSHCWCILVSIVLHSVLLLPGCCFLTREDCRMDVMVVVIVAMCTAILMLTEMQVPFTARYDRTTLVNIDCYIVDALPCYTVDVLTAMSCIMLALTHQLGPLVSPVHLYRP